MSAWHRYWFTPAPCFDLAVVRILAVAIQLLWMVLFVQLLGSIEARAALPDQSWQPLFIMKLMNLPFGWGYRPDFELVEVVYYVALGSGVLALVGLCTNLSLCLFTASCVYLHAFNYSFNDFHHPEAVMMVALGALALSPAGRVLSLDALIRRRWRIRPQEEDWLQQTSAFAGWPIKMIQWFFVLMYLSAVRSKLFASGLDWANGFTLQYYLAMDGLRWDSPLALWFSQHHLLIELGQYGVLLFQATFVLAVVFPRLRWIYVPAGLALHTSIYLTLTAPFFQWMVLYAVFIPWAGALKMARQRMPQARIDTGRRTA